VGHTKEQYVLHLLWLIQEQSEIGVKTFLLADKNPQQNNVLTGFSD
jgi:hypothetical protein